MRVLPCPHHPRRFHPGERALGTEATPRDKGSDRMGFVPLQLERLTYPDGLARAARGKVSVCSELRGKGDS